MTQITKKQVRTSERRFKKLLKRPLDKPLKKDEKEFVYLSLRRDILELTSNHLVRLKKQAKIIRQREKKEKKEKNQINQHNDQFKKIQKEYYENLLQEKFGDKKLYSKDYKDKAFKYNINFSDKEIKM